MQTHSGVLPSVLIIAQSTENSFRIKHENPISIDLKKGKDRKHIKKNKMGSREPRVIVNNYAFFWETISASI